MVETARNRAAKFQGMVATLPGKKILEFPTLIGVGNQTNLRAAADKRAAHVNGRSRDVTNTLGMPMRELKSGLVNHGRVQDGCFCQLKVLLRRRRSVRAFWQRESADTVIVRTRMIEAVTHDQRVVGVELIVQARAEGKGSPRHNHTKTQRKRI